jgi:predicted O-methyltransferase YrrM
MSVLPKLLRIYSDRGFEIQTGLSPGHFFGDPLVVTTHLFRGDDDVETGRGIALPEIHFFEILIDALAPRGILTIGNGFGWSSVAISLMEPDARHIVIDGCQQEDGGSFGQALTNQIAREEGLNLEVVQGWSPRDVAAIVKDRLTTPVDLVFIDGEHTDDQIVRDYVACSRVASDRCVMTFHDVLNHRMTAGFEAISKAAEGMKARLLYRTPTGIGAIYPVDSNPCVAAAVESFYEEPGRVEALRRRTFQARLNGCVNTAAAAFSRQLATDSR